MIDNINIVKEAQKYAVEKLKHFNWLRGVGIGLSGNNSVKYGLKINVADESAKEYIQKNLNQIVPNFNKIPVTIEVVGEIKIL